MNEDCIKNARIHYGSVPSADEALGFGFGAAVNGESKQCMNCKHLVGSDGELCQKRKNRITDCTENINPEGGNFSPLLKLIISDKVCEKFEFEEDSDRRRENNEKEMEFLLKNLDSLKKQTGDAERTEPECRKSDFQQRQFSNDRHPDRQHHHQYRCHKTGITNNKKGLGKK